MFLNLLATQPTINLVQKVADAGADAVLVYNPGYFKEKMDFNACYRHFESIAAQSPVPVVLFNLLGHSQQDIPIDVVTALAANPKIAGILETGNDLARTCIICKETEQYSSRSGNPFHVVTLKASTYLPALSIGVSGVISTLANVLPFEVCQIGRLLKHGKWEEAQQLQWRLAGPCEAVTTTYGVPGLKAALREFLDIDTGSVRSPLRNLNEEEVKNLKNIFHHSGFFLDGKAK